MRTEEGIEKRIAYRASIGRQFVEGNLEEQAIVQMSPWATPQSRDYRSPDAQGSQRWQRKEEQGWSLNVNDQAALVIPSGATQSGSLAQTGNSGQLNPALSRWLMGLPPIWCAAAIQADRQLKLSKPKRQRKPGLCE